jgi:hypothetical protein
MRLIVTTGAEPKVKSFREIAEHTIAAATDDRDAYRRLLLTLSLSVLRRLATLAVVGKTGAPICREIRRFCSELDEKRKAIDFLVHVADAGELRRGLEIADDFAR